MIIRGDFCKIGKTIALGIDQPNNFFICSPPLTVNAMVRLTVIIFAKPKIV